MGLLSIWLLTWVGLAFVPAFIASTKGRSGIGYFLLGLFLPIIGIIIAVGVSDNRRHVVGRAARNNDLGPQPDLHANEKKCPACAEWVLREARKCKHCGEAFDGPAASPGSMPTGMGYCPGCSKLRGHAVPKCIYCGDTASVEVAPRPV